MNESKATSTENATPAKPTPLPVNPEGIPAELRERRQWLTWRYEWNADKQKWDKPPRQASNGRLAGSDNPATWAAFEDALARYQAGESDGVGYVFTPDDPYTGVDLDKVTPGITGELEPWAADEVRRLASYTELSPSGTGVHVIVKATLKAGHKDTARGIEVYDRGRYFTMTGVIVNGLATIEDRQAAIDDLCARYWPAKETPPPPARAGTLDISDAALLAKARAAKNGAKFDALWRGDWQAEGYPSQSEADAALCHMLAFWTQNDAGRIDGMFRQSGLMRDKWNERHGERGTYGEITIAHAIDGTSEVYDPHHGGGNGQRPGATIEDTAPSSPAEPLTPPQKTNQYAPRAVQAEWTAQELLSAHFEPPQWVVPDLLPDGLACLSGRPKQGKSWLALQLAIARAAGGKFLGRDITPGNVLYLAYEDSPRRLQGRLQMLSCPADIPLTVRLDFPALNGDAGLSELQTRIVRDSLSLVIVDTLSRAFGQARIDWDNIGQVTGIVGPLQRMALACDVTILSLDHNRKSNGFVSDQIDDVLGSTGKTAVLDSLLSLYRKRGERQATLKATGRDIDEKEIVIEFTEHGWQLVGDARDVAQKKAEADILDALNNLEETDAGDIAEYVKKARPSVIPVLKRLAAEGKITTRTIPVKRGTNKIVYGRKA